MRESLTVSETDQCHLRNSKERASIIDQSAVRHQTTTTMLFEFEELLEKVRTGLGERMGLLLRESRILTPSGRGVRAHAT